MRYVSYLSIFNGIEGSSYNNPSFRKLLMETEDCATACHIKSY